MKGRAVGRWVAVALGLVVPALVVAWLLRPGPQQQETASTADVPLPADVPYAFVWPRGAARGTDLPTAIVVPGVEEPLPIYPVGDLRSETGEGKIAFLQRVRHELVAYSTKQTHEACAVICSDGSSYSVRMATVAATTFCAMAEVCMAGHASIRETIHSHCPHRAGLRATLADQRLSGGRRRNGRPFGMCDPNRFSKTDFDGWRPGWLAGVDALYRQDGPGRIDVYR